MTRTDELRTAAARLFAAALAAQEDVNTNAYFACYDPATAYRDGLVNGFGGKSGDLAGMCTPDVMIGIARWLDHDAVQHVPVSECRYCDPATNPGRVPCPGLTVARAINPAPEEPTR